MRPDERAEKIRSYFVPKLYEHEQRDLDFVLAEIRAAVAEAGQECSKCKRAHAKYCAECFEGEKRAAVEESDGDWLADHASEIHDKARMEAYADAARIADTWKWGSTIAKCIRARAKELQ